jgi:hypothetical protein
MSSGLQNSPCFAVARCAVGKEHRAELATNEIERRIFKRQRQSIRLTPFDTSVGRLSRCGVVDHRLVEVGYDIACAPGQSWRQGAGDNPARKSTAPYSGRSFPESSRRTPCQFPTWLITRHPFDGSHDYHRIVRCGSITSIRPWPRHVRYPPNHCNNVDLQ